MDKFTKANCNLSLFCQNYMSLKKNLPIRPSEMGLLNVISEGDYKYTSIDLAKILNVTKPMITAHITSLIEKGYVNKIQSIDDKRVFYIIPTNKALDLVLELKNDLNKKFKELIKNIGKSEFNLFVSIAEKINCFFEEK